MIPHIFLWLVFCNIDNLRVVRNNCHVTIEDGYVIAAILIEVEIDRVGVIVDDGCQFSAACREVLQIAAWVDAVLKAPDTAAAQNRAGSVFVECNDGNRRFGCIRPGSDGFRYDLHCRRYDGAVDKRLIPLRRWVDQGVCVCFYNV